VSQRLSDEDVDRIASRVVSRGLVYAVVIVGTLLFLPALLFPILATIARLTSGLPAPLAVAITAAVIAMPLIAVIWFRGRTRRRTR
jgi:hypothetical protein